MTAVEQFIKTLQDDRNAIDQLSGLLINLQSVPQVLENQKRIIELLELRSSSDFRQHVINTTARLNTLAG